MFELDSKWVNSGKANTKLIAMVIWGRGQLRQEPVKCDEKGDIGFDGWITSMEVSCQSQ